MANVEPRAWAFAYTLDSLNVSVTEGLLGTTVRFRKPMSTVRAGDLAVVYVTRAGIDTKKHADRISAFRALFEVTGPSFEDNTVLWPARSELYPIRVPVRLLHRLGVPIASVLYDLSFITSKLFYGLAFLNSPRTIPMEDARRILAANVPPIHLEPRRGVSGV